MRFDDLIDDTLDAPAQTSRLQVPLTDQICVRRPGTSCDRPDAPQVVPPRVTPPDDTLIDTPLGPTDDDKQPDPVKPTPKEPAKLPPLCDMPAPRPKPPVKPPVVVKEPPVVVKEPPVKEPMKPTPKPPVVESNPCDPMPPNGTPEYCRCKYGDNYPANCVQSTPPDPTITFDDNKPDKPRFDAVNPCDPPPPLGTVEYCRCKYGDNYPADCVQGQPSGEKVPNPNVFVEPKQPMPTQKVPPKTPIQGTVVYPVKPPEKDRCAPPVANEDICFCTPDNELCQSQTTDGKAPTGKHPDLLDSPFDDGTPAVVLKPKTQSKVVSPTIEKLADDPKGTPEIVVLAAPEVKGAGELPLRSEFLDMSFDAQCELIDEICDDTGTRSDLESRLLRGDNNGVFDALAVKAAMGLAPAGAVAASLVPGVPTLAEGREFWNSLPREWRDRFLRARIIDIYSQPWWGQAVRECSSLGTLGRRIGESQGDYESRVETQERCRLDFDKVNRSPAFFPALMNWMMARNKAQADPEKTKRLAREYVSTADRNVAIGQLFNSVLNAPGGIAANVFVRWLFSQNIEAQYAIFDRWGGQPDASSIVITPGTPTGRPGEAQATQIGTPFSTDGYPARTSGSAISLVVPYWGRLSGGDKYNLISRAVGQNVLNYPEAQQVQRSGGNWDLYFMPGQAAETKRATTIGTWIPFAEWIVRTYNLTRYSINPASGISAPAGSSCSSANGLRVTPAGLANDLIESPFDDAPSMPQRALSFTLEPSADLGGGPRGGMRVTPAAAVDSGMTVDAAKAKLDAARRRLTVDMAQQMDQVNRIAGDTLNNIKAPVPPIVLEAGTLLTGLQSRFGGRINIVLPNLDAIRTGNDLFVASKLGGSTVINQMLTQQVDRISREAAALADQYAVFTSRAFAVLDAVRLNDNTRLQSALITLASTPVSS